MAKSKYHHGNLREALIEASLQLIREQGVRALTLREIGKLAGVSRMAAYRHFTDKEDLLAAICAAGFLQFGDALEAAYQQAPDNFDLRMEALAVAYVRFAVTSRSYYEVMFESTRGQVPDKAQVAATRAFQILERTIREGQEQGKIRQGDPEELARVVWALVHGISTLPVNKDLSEGGDGWKYVVLSAELMRIGLRPLP